MSETLTVVGVRSIQDYVFRSNRLRENVGASELIEKAMENLKERAPDRVIIHRGGNAVLHSPIIDAAKKLIAEWSGVWLTKAPRLQFAAAHEIVGGDWNQAYSHCKWNLLDEENKPPAGEELAALPVVRTCPSTSLAASASSAGDFVSHEVALKRGALPVRFDYKDDYAFPADLDNLGMSAGASQIAVVHVDGNEFGELFSYLPADKEGFIRELTDRSGKVYKLMEDAFEAVTNEVAEALKIWQSSEERILDIKLNDYGKLYLPLRKVILAGDDLTWISAGRIGLVTATRFFQHFRDRAAKLGWNHLTACAGVLILPKGFPFSRAHKMAEELCAKAKASRRGKDLGSCFLDFHVQMEGSAGPIEETRRMLLTDPEGKPLCSRPVKWPDEWETLESRWAHFRDNWPRSRAKAIFQRIPSGEQAFDELKNLYRTQGYELPDGGRANDFFDPLEILDFHTRLPRDQEAPHA